ncbi:helix-turn-helix domain-containing protein [uncultured Odoribacter sp.]|uniref:helix-turn-helix domain-containing protein n=1 Tax=uncultured Odoribacter sp. TaxID=876416 RepID=UPI0026092115|nr:helix-turn-helix domain-containing protein [uncultured Odoribacter sp.]
MNEKLTSIETYVIDAVSKRRKECCITTRALSISIGLEESFVGLVENPKTRTKYSLNHLNEIAKILNCSLSDFFPPSPLPENCIQEYKKIQGKKTVS